MSSISNAIAMNFVKYASPEMAACMIAGVPIEGTAFGTAKNSGLVMSMRTVPVTMHRDDSQEIIAVSWIDGDGSSRMCSFADCEMDRDVMSDSDEEDTFLM